MVKDSVCIVIIRERFFDLRSVAAGSQDELCCKAYPWGCEGKCEGRKFTLTLTLTTETPINRAFQTKSEGVRVKKEKFFFISKEEHPSSHSIYNMKMNRDKPCHNSFCEPAATERRSKKHTNVSCRCGLRQSETGRIEYPLQRECIEFLVIPFVELMYRLCALGESVLSILEDQYVHSVATE